MQEIATFTEDVVNKARTHMEILVNRTFPDLECACPACGATRLKQTDATYECREQECDFRISKHVAGRKLSESEAVELFSTKKLPEMDGYLSRFNKPFSAALELVQNVTKTGKIGKWKTNFVFEDDLDSADELTEDQLLKSITLQNGLDAKFYVTDKAYHVPDFKHKD